MTFEKGHAYYKPKPDKPKVNKEQKVTEAAIKAQQDKALSGDTKAFDAIMRYMLNKGKMEAESDYKFHADAFLKAFDEAVLEREKIIKETNLTVIANKGAENSISQTVG